MRKVHGAAVYPPIAQALHTPLMETEIHVCVGLKGSLTLAFRKYKKLLATFVEIVQQMQHALERLNIQSISRDACKWLIGIGKDGASCRSRVKRVDRSANGTMQHALERLNIRCMRAKGLLDWNRWRTDALKGTFFDSWMICYFVSTTVYVYEKIPKKCQELDAELKNKRIHVLCIILYCKVSKRIRCLIWLYTNHSAASPLPGPSPSCVTLRPCKDCAGWKT